MRSLDPCFCYPSEEYVSNYSFASRFEFLSLWSDSPGHSPVSNQKSSGCSSMVRKPKLEFFALESELTWKVDARNLC